MMAASTSGAITFFSSAVQGLDQRRVDLLLDDLVPVLAADPALLAANHAGLHCAFEVVLGETPLCLAPDLVCKTGGIQESKRL
jgi:hypothetical protein